MTWEIRQGDALERLREMPDESVQCCVTSPPYWGLRDYGTAVWEGGDPECDHRGRGANRKGRETPGGRGGSMPSNETPFRDDCGLCGARRVDRQLGLEETPEQFVAAMVEVFAEVRRVLRADGTCWVNIGDTFCAGARGERQPTSLRGPDVPSGWSNRSSPVRTPAVPSEGIKVKDLVGIPWMLAFALRADGWYLRRDIIWSKPNPMPESVTDRPTSAHEYVFLLSKAPRYFYDAEAIREPGVWPGQSRSERGPVDSQVPGAPSHNGLRQDKQRGHGRRHAGFNERWDAMPKEQQQALGRNKRSVWTIATRPYPEAHFATFPPDLVEPCVLAGSKPGDTILDPFAGAATTGLVATQHGRDFIGIELNPEYVQLGEDRIRRWEANPAGHLEGDPDPLEGQLSIEEAAA